MTTTVSVKLPVRLATRVQAEAKRRRTSKASVIRERLEESFNAAPPQVSCLDLAGDVVGCLSGASDLATNPKYMKDFGR